MLKRNELPATLALAKSLAGATPETEPKRSKSGIKGQASRLQGDSELTEPETEDDSLFGDDPGIIEPAAYQDEGPKPDSLTSEQLIQRRLENVKSLYSLYKVEYWGLLEELRTRHARFKSKQAERASQDPQSSQQAGPTIAKKRVLEDASDLRTLVKRRRGESGAAGEPGSVPAAAPSDEVRLEGRAEEAQQSEANSLSEEARGYGSGEEPPTFSDAEAVLLEGGEGPPLATGPASKATVQQWRSEFREKLPLLGRLEQAASGSAGREMDSAGALACLCGRNNRFYIKSSAVSLGRATDTHQVDIDLSSEGDARKVSRLQAHLSMSPAALFQLKNVGRRTLLVNNRQVDQGQVAQLGHLSLVEVGGVRLLFMVNHAAAKRATARTLQLRA